MKKQKFDLGTILSVATPILFTNIDNVYKILNYMTGDDLFTHQLIRGCEECKPVILRQYPQFKNIDTSNVNNENWERFLNKKIEEFGNEFEVEPVGLFEHKFIDPIEELGQMFDSDKITIVRN